MVHDILYLYANSIYILMRTSPTKIIWQPGPGLADHSSVNADGYENIMKTTSVFDIKIRCKFEENV